MIMRTKNLIFFLVTLTFLLIALTGCQSENKITFDAFGDKIYLVQSESEAEDGGELTNKDGSVITTLPNIDLSLPVSLSTDYALGYEVATLEYRSRASADYNNMSSPLFAHLAKKDGEHWELIAVGREREFIDDYDGDGIKEIVTSFGIDDYYYTLVYKNCGDSISVAYPARAFDQLYEVYSSSVIPRFEDWDFWETYYEGLFFSADNYATEKLLFDQLVFEPFDSTNLLERISVSDSSLYAAIDTLNTAIDEVTSKDYRYDKENFTISLNRSNIKLNIKDIRDDIVTIHANFNYHQRQEDFVTAYYDYRLKKESDGSFTIENFISPDALIKEKQSRSREPLNDLGNEIKCLKVSQISVPGLDETWDDGGFAYLIDYALLLDESGHIKEVRFNQDFASFWFNQWNWRDGKYLSQHGGFGSSYHAWDYLISQDGYSVQIIGEIAVPTLAYDNESKEYVQNSVNKVYLFTIDLAK